MSVAVGVADRLGELEGLFEPDGVSVFVTDGVCVPVPDALAHADGTADTVALTSDDALAEGDDDSGATALAVCAAVTDLSCVDVELPVKIAVTLDDALAGGDRDSRARALAVCVSLVETIAVAVAEPRVGSGDGVVTADMEESRDPVASDVPVLVAETNDVSVAAAIEAVADKSTEAVSRTDGDADASADAVTDENAVTDTAGEAVTVVAVEAEVIAVTEDVARAIAGAVADGDAAGLPVPAAETVARSLAVAVFVALEPTEDDGGGAEGADEEDAVPQSVGPGERLGRLLRDAVELGGADAVEENVGGVVDMKII